MDTASLRNLAFSSLVNLSTPEGINASGKDEIYGCIFGRDSALTILKMLKVYGKSPSPELLEISGRTLITLAGLQGRELNKESGEAPGKFIHEFRKERNQYAHLLAAEKPWYVYDDMTLKNYDSIDSTPLIMIAMYRYYQITRDENFLMQVMPSVEAGLQWMLLCGDIDNDTLVEYELPADRIHGGLSVQSWTDSRESLLGKTGVFPKYPIAPVEVQGYTWLALRLWADFFALRSNPLARPLRLRARLMKKRFNEAFVYKDRNLYFTGQALDGDKRLITTVTGNPALLLWATYVNGNRRECILEAAYIPSLVKRLMMDDLFDPDAGLRTMSALSDTYNPNQDSYHNGSFWPILNGLAFEGFENWKFHMEASLLKHASVKPLEFFRSPVELYVKGAGGNYLEYANSSGQKGCRVQAWSAAAALDFLTD